MDFHIILKLLNIFIFLYYAQCKQGIIFEKGKINENMCADSIQT